MQVRRGKKFMKAIQVAQETQETCDAVREESRKKVTLPKLRFGPVNLLTGEKGPCLAVVDDPALHEEMLRGTPPARCS